MAAISAQSIVLLIFTLFSVPVAICDAKTMHVPASVVYAGCLLLLLFRFIYTRDVLVFCVIAAVCSAALFTIVRLLSDKGIGWGDIKYSVFCGLSAGFSASFAGYAFSACLCGVWFAVMHRRGRIANESKIPFVPFMALGIFLAQAAAIGVAAFAKRG
jgi:Type II secretory pathway, prepilin signal peptidase PulO and related peptidases